MKPKKLFLAGMVTALAIGVGVACSSSSSSSSDSSSTTCTNTDNTTETATVSAYGCALLTRDTTSCQASRTAQGLSGYWLKFSCRVTLTKSGSNVVISTDNTPDYKSSYYATSNGCYQAFATPGSRFANPNRIATKSISMTVPYSPSAAGSNTATPDGVVGIALNGVAIFDNTAAPGDDIYQEQFTFDKCDGHPEATGIYHYHDEPSSITSADDNFIGVLRDGFPVYGRKDFATGSVATGLDAAGGKTGTTVDSASPVYHYHANLQTNGTYSIYFLTLGYYHGTPGSCTGC